MVLKEEVKKRCESEVRKIWRGRILISIAL